MNALKLLDHWAGTILRKNAGEAQNELADYLGISRGSLANYETGKRKPDINTIIRIARRYNTSTDYILGLSDIFDYEWKGDI